VKNSNIAEKYKNILYRIFEVQDYIKIYVDNTAFISLLTLHTNHDNAYK
jgi:hypothetical protein